jgi:hypothetical protein
MEHIDNQLKKALDASVDHITFNRQREVLKQIAKSESEIEPSSKKPLRFLKPVVAAAAAVMVISSISLGSISIVLPHGPTQHEEQIVVTNGVSFAALQHLVQ